MNKTLLIISHTPHYRSDDGKIVGWASTVNEVDELSKLFNKVIHVACFYKGKAPAGLEAYSSTKVEFAPLPPFGGVGFKKLSVIYTAPVIIWKIFLQLTRATHFQFRAPTSMGVYIIPLLTWFTRKRGWFKYAGNWIQEKPPLSYRWQRYFLTHLQKRKVTINGHWPDQPPHCLTFENPCFSMKDSEEGWKAIKNKKYHPPYNICFVGRLDESKGLDVFVEALTGLDKSPFIDNVFIVGDGDNRFHFETRAKSLPYKVHFFGFLKRKELFDVFKGSHFLVLPSKSEGFPKVISEGWNFGCLPIATEVSSIGQYVKNQVNGFTFTPAERNPVYLGQLLNSIFIKMDLDVCAGYGYEVAKLFTYERYLRHLSESVLQVDE